METFFALLALVWGLHRSRIQNVHSSLLGGYGVSVTWRRLVHVANCHVTRNWYLSETLSIRLLYSLHKKKYTHSHFPCQFCILVRGLGQSCLQPIQSSISYITVIVCWFASVLYHVRPWTQLLLAIYWKSLFLYACKELFLSRCLSPCWGEVAIIMTLHCFLAFSPCIRSCFLSTPGSLISITDLLYPVSPLFVSYHRGVPSACLLTFENSLKRKYQYFEDIFFHWLHRELLKWNN